jgi:hypothetical protein
MIKELFGSPGPCLGSVSSCGWQSWVGCVQEIGFTSSKLIPLVFSAMWMMSLIVTFSLGANGLLFSGIGSSIGCTSPEICLHWTELLGAFVKVGVVLMAE